MWNGNCIGQTSAGLSNPRPMGQIQPMMCLDLAGGITLEMVRCHPSQSSQVLPQGNCSTLAPGCSLASSLPTGLQRLPSSVLLLPPPPLAKLGLQLQKAMGIPPKESGRGGREGGQGEQPVPGFAGGEASERADCHGA